MLFHAVYILTLLTDGHIKHKQKQTSILKTIIIIIILQVCTISCFETAFYLDFND